MNLDAWVISFLKKQGYDYGLLLDSREEKRLWQQACAEKPAGVDLSMAFFQEEWARVIQPQSVDSVERYKQASRIGRSARLKVNYRATDETRRLAVGILEGIPVDDLDGGEDSQAFYHSLMHGPAPEIRRFASPGQQADGILQQLIEHRLVPEACTACAIWHDFPNLTRGPCWMSQFTFAAAEQAGKKRDTRRAARPGGAMKWWYGRKYPGTCRQLPVG